MWHLPSLPQFFLLLSFYTFGIYLQGANLCKSISSSNERLYVYYKIYPRKHLNHICKQQKTETRCYLCNWKFHLQSIQAYRYNYETPRYCYRQH